MRWIALTALLGAVAPATVQPAGEAPAPASNGAPAPDDGGFLLDVRVAAGLTIAYPSSRASALVPVTLGIGWRFRGGYGAAAIVEPSSGDLADLAYALDPSAPAEPSRCGASGCGFRLVLGVEGSRRFERTAWQPWLGVLAGLEGLDVGDGAQTESWFGWVIRLTGGVPVMRTWQLELGLFASAELGVWTDHELEVGGVTTVLSVGQAVHGAALLGVRVAWLP